MMTEFNPEEQTLVGAHSIEASAGTGKTYSITILWLRMLLEEGLSIDQILISTFTKAATAELQERLLAALREAKAAVQRLKGEGEGEADNMVEGVVARAIKGGVDVEFLLDKALSNFDLAPIFTIHGFCQTLLSRMALEMGGDPDLELVENDDEFRKTLVEDLMMMERNHAPFDMKKAHQIAKVIAEEMGVEHKNLHMPPEPNVTKKDYIQAMKSLTEELPVDDILENINAGSRNKTRRILSGLCEGVMTETFSANVVETISSNYPTVWKNILIIRDYPTGLRNAFVRNLVHNVRNDLQRKKVEAGVRCFNDILIDLRNAIRAEGENGPIGKSVRNRYQAVIIDECQDSDGVQIEVFKKLFLSDDDVNKAQRSLIVIGDPKQSIYRFRGADLASYCELTDSMREAPEMRTNHRSDPSLVRAINDLYKGKEQFAGERIKYVAVSAAKEDRIVDKKRPKPAYTIWSDLPRKNPALSDICAQFAREANRILNGRVQIKDRESDKMRPVEANDIAVLAESHSTLSVVRRALQRAGVPCQQSGRGLGKVIESEEANDLQIWLEALDAVSTGSGRQMSKIQTFAASPLHGLGAKSCLELSESPEQQSQLITELKKEAKAFLHEGPLPVLTRRISQIENLTRNLGFKDGERRITNWRHLATTLQSDWMSGLRSLGPLSAKMGRRISTQSENEEMMRLETDLPAVQLVTLHGSKGLEYPIVFCPSLWAMKSQSFRKSNTQVAVLRKTDGSLLDTGSEDFEARRDDMLMQEDEELDRLLYVALTRPRHRLYIGMAPVESGKGNHQNGAERSSIAKLMRIQELEFSEWKEEVSKFWPILEMTPSEKRSEDLSSSGSKSILHRPPEVDPWKNPLIYRTSSYSSLSAGHEHTRDYDETRPEEEVVKGDSDPGVLVGLGGGATLGNEVHDLLEQILGNGSDIESLILKGDGDRGEKLINAIKVILDSPMTLPGHTQATSLSALVPKVMAEMYFMLPVVGEGLSPEILSGALLSDPDIKGNESKRVWAEGIADWSFEKLRGFLQGFIDLTFEYEGKWWILDYKTNQLSGYGVDEISQSMIDKDYLLQSRLYAVALHRHLKNNLKGYDYNLHFGGCVYLYVRGCPHNGVWAECPSWEGMEALDGLFGKGA